MAAAMDAIMPYMHERKQFGQAIGEFQLMQGKIADMYTAMNSSRAYVYAVAAACDRGEVTRQDAAACCLFASDRAMEQSVEAIQAMGGAGYLNDNPTGRIMRDAKLMQIGAGTQEIAPDADRPGAVRGNRVIARCSVLAATAFAVALHTTFATGADLDPDLVC